jgi:hypothetical protein
VGLRSNSRDWLRAEFCRPAESSYLREYVSEFRIIRIFTMHALKPPGRQSGKIGKTSKRLTCEERF